MCQKCGCTPCKTCGMEIEDGLCVGCGLPADECMCEEDLGEEGMEEE
jgi:hypothetical protein